MKERILIVEDQFVEADYLRLMLTQAGYRVTGIAHSVPDAQKMIEQERPDFVFLDIFLRGKLTGIDLAKQLADENIAFIYLSANSNEDVLSAAKATQPYGFLIKPFREKDLLVTLEIAHYRHQNSLEANFRREQVLLDKLSAIASEVSPWETKLLNIGRTLQPYIPFDLLMAGSIGYLRMGYDEYEKIASAANQEFVERFDLKSTLEHSPICFYSRKPDSYNAGHAGLLNLLQKPIGMALESPRTVIKFPDVVREATAKPPGFEGIIGKSQILLNVFDLIEQVAPMDTSVLILGESGTGKERIADAIHNLSPRKNKPLVKINCAALPATLIESELFGHEKGAFTGAIDSRIGKFEKANKGTIFLDEIGEIPPDLQVKLLRVLQEKTIERIGARDVTRVDVRIIAATNRNLEKEVAEGRFRLDLYYRLNVFPIELPPLRERTEDIPVLARHFLQIYNRKAGKKITGFSDKVMKNMLAYHWPGNIREFENLIERAVLMSKGTVIEDVAIPIKISTGIPNTHVKSIQENERDHIISVLKKCNGRIWGSGGAAETLNVPPTTLRSKMKKLGILKKEYTSPL